MPLSTALPRTARTASLARPALLALAGALALTLGAKIQVPFWPVPMTLQTLALMLVIGLGGLRLALASVTAYLGAGLAGLPVFAGALAGPAYFAGPTAGFLAGFLVAAGIGGWLIGRSPRPQPLRIAAALLAAEIALFTPGVLWLALVYAPASGAAALSQAFALGAAPFLLAEIVKLGLATALLAGRVRFFT